MGLEEGIIMETTNETVTISKGARWGGAVMAAIPVLMLLMSAVMKLMKHPKAVQGFTTGGYPADAATVLGIIELTCTIIYLIPRTSVLGAILLTGYFGGAVDSMYRASGHPGPDPVPPSWFPVIFGVLIWGALFLRDPRIRALIPLRAPLKKLS
jgi:hypothetical protein